MLLLLMIMFHHCYCRWWPKPLFSNWIYLLLIVTKTFIIVDNHTQLLMVESIRILRYFDQHKTIDQNDHHHHHHRIVEQIKTLIGSNLTLDCHVQLESNDRLYSLKWYRQYNGSYYEFYSYSKYLIIIFLLLSNLININRID